MSATAYLRSYTRMCLFTPENHQARSEQGERADTPSEALIRRYEQGPAEISATAYLLVCTGEAGMYSYRGNIGVCQAPFR